MPINKSALIRYFIIDELLCSGKKEYYSLSDLMNAFRLKEITVSERTIRRDIQDMIDNKLLGYNAPIVKYRSPKGHFKGYYYEKSGYSIRNLNFTEEQFKAFDFVVRQLHEYLDLAVMQEFLGVIEKLIGVFTQLRHKELSACIQYEKVPHYEGLQHRDVIVDAIINKKIITVKYTTFKRTRAYTHVIEPYVLKEYKNWWYVLGVMQNKQKPILLALDRIDSIVVQERTYINKSNFEATHYFDDIVGVTKTDDPVQTVLLRATQDLYKYLTKVPVHASQKIVEENKTHVIIQLNVQNNYELRSAIVGHNSGMMVLEPAGLRDEVKKMHIDALKQYE